MGGVGTLWRVRGRPVSEVVLYNTVINFKLLMVVALICSFHSKLHSSIELVLLSYHTVLTCTEYRPFGYGFLLFICAGPYRFFYGSIVLVGVCVCVFPGIFSAFDISVPLLHL